MSKSKIKISLICLLCICLFQCILSSKVLAERGVTDTEIRIGIWGPLTGPAALWGEVPRGIKCYFDMINAEGGIAGRKIVYYLRDDGYIPSRTMDIAKDLVENKQIFAVASGVGTSCGMAVKEYLNNKKVPWVGPASGSTHWAYPPTPYLFSVYPLFCSESAILANYAIEKMGKKRIAFFYQNDDYGKTGLYGAQLALEKLNTKLVAEVAVDPMDANIDSQYSQLSEANPDCIIMYVIPKHVALMLKIANEKGLKVQWMCCSTFSDTHVMYQITKGLFKDVILPTFFESSTAPSPLFQKYKDSHDKFSPDDRWGYFFIGGFALVEPMVEGLRKCGRDLTADNFVKAMESIHDFQGIGTKVSFGPDQRQGGKSAFLIKCIDGDNVEKLTDWIFADIDLQEVIKRLNK